MRVSVVVPLYNKAEYVERCLRSVCCQTLQDFELIVVNDGSTDGSDVMVLRFTDQRIRLVNQQNGGPGAARNRGLAEARGEYVAFLDADDEWRPEYLSRAVCALDRYRAAGSTTCQYREHPAAREVQDLWHQRGIREGMLRITEESDPVFLVHAVAYMHPCTTVSRTSVLRRLGGFYAADRCLYAEDAYLFVQVIVNYPVHFSLSPDTLIHRDAAQLSGNLPGCRPLEPFLVHPERVLSSCPSDLQPILKQFLAIRAFKTACVFGFWGDWREAKRIRGEYRNAPNWRLPLLLPSMVCATPFGSLLGAAWRRFS